eukprot:1292738-Amphidinium_carterae.1
MSREDLLRQELRQAQQHTELQEYRYEAQTNVYEADRYYQALVKLNQNASNYHEQIRRFAFDFQQRAVAEAESRDSQSIAGLQQSAAGLQQNQGKPTPASPDCRKNIRLQSKLGVTTWLGWTHWISARRKSICADCATRTCTGWVSLLTRERTTSSSAWSTLVFQLGQESFRSEAQKFRAHLNSLQMTHMPSTTPEWR